MSAFDSEWDALRHRQDDWTDWSSEDVRNWIEEDAKQQEALEDEDRDVDLDLLSEPDRAAEIAAALEGVTAWDVEEDDYSEESMP